MECLSSVYEWRANTATSSDSSTACSCADQSAAEQQVQLLQAEVELRQLRDRVRKSLRKWLGDEAQRQKGPPIRIDWQLTAGELAEQLCFWKHSSALTQAGMTPAVAELLRHHRRLEGAHDEPPASKNALMLVVWDLAATVQAKLWHWRECMQLASNQPSFDGRIVVRVADVVPIWTWEADTLRNRPAFTQVCSRMLSMELWHYRQHCRQITASEKQLLRDHEPYLTPMGLRWRARALLPDAPRPLLVYALPSKPKAVSSHAHSIGSASRILPSSKGSSNRAHSDRQLENDSGDSQTSSNDSNSYSDSNSDSNGSDEESDGDGSDESTRQHRLPTSAASSSSSRPVSSRSLGRLQFATAPARSTKAAPSAKKRHG